MQSRAIVGSLGRPKNLGNSGFTVNPPYAGDVLGYIVAPGSLKYISIPADSVSSNSVSDSGWRNGGVIAGAGNQCGY